MEAHFFRSAALAGALLAVCTLGSSLANAAGFRGENFTVNASTPELAREIGLAAERLRKELAIEWLGKEMPPWSKPCPINAQVSSGLGAGGATSFLFQNGEVFKWRMSIQGSRERILDSVLPHEITHTIFASHFRQPLPRWADEGACTTVEHESEKAKQKRMLIRFLKTGHGIAFSDLFAMKEYPADVMPLYSQGYSLARFLIAQGGKKKFLAFVGDGMRDENWPRAVREHYGAESLWALQDTWLDWVRDGSPELDKAPGNRSYTQLARASASQNATRSKSDVIYRAQSADPSEEPRARNRLASSAATRPPVRQASSIQPAREGSTPSVYQRNRSQRDAPGDSLQMTPEKSPGKTSSRDIGPVEDSPTATEPAKTGAPRRSRVLLDWQRPAETRTSPLSAVYDSRLDRGTVLR